MSIKKYTNDSWVSASYRKYGTETDSITTLPATIIGDGTPISSYTIKGNMEQSGAPTPSSPIYPSECGERTENLWNGDEITRIQVTSDASIERYGIAFSGSVFSLCLISDTQVFYKIKTGDTYGEPIQLLVDVAITITMTDNQTLMVYGQNQLLLKQAAIQVNNGSTILPYEPYGYKLPITLGSATTNIYLGEVQSTRRIKKLVLTGEEVTWGSYINDRGRFIVSPPDILSGTDRGLVFSDRYNNAYKVPELNNNSVENAIAIYEDKIYIYTTGDYTTLTSFKSYLAAQYAAGTPVTVWYVLAEPETAVVNEPLRKIGDYVDSVSGTGLATSGTAQEFDVGTALKPSEADLTYHGWHEHDDTKFTT